jgi:hypothetical protein
MVLVKVKWASKAEKGAIGRKRERERDGEKAHGKNMQIRGFGV